MFREKLTPGIQQSVLFKWWYLAWVAGQINAGGWLSTGRFVSHVTGFATLFGVEIGHQHWMAAVGMMTVPLFFLLGVMISGQLIEARILKDQHPLFDWVMALVILCLLICAIGGSLNRLGTFGAMIQGEEDYLLMGLLCLSAGLINGAISSSSARSVRVTHLTGATTDMGLAMTRWWAMRANPEAAKKESLVAKFRFGTVLSFAFGSAVSTVLYLKYQYLGFLLPAACAFFPLVEARRAIRKNSNLMY